MFSLCLCGFSPGPLVSSPSQSCVCEVTILSVGVTGPETEGCLVQGGSHRVGGRWVGGAGPTQRPELLGEFLTTSD